MSKCGYHLLYYSTCLNTTSYLLLIHFSIFLNDDYDFEKFQKFSQTELQTAWSVNPLKNFTIDG
ncbi:hypothetical protein BpHYR1_001920 [Brachionus plicatilis]|uniref:Uncharacterized protein n=1 Tax=Brachionus plicatilis TaxID=10195 RepID=A0A3M7SCR6_BRAPC|nr:hypothetical protein BpHYR1_001920 [Brachionus plicatilis]